MYLYQEYGAQNVVAADFALSPASALAKSTALGGSGSRPRDGKHSGLIMPTLTPTPNFGN